jgi:hypothetical protein
VDQKREKGIEEDQIMEPVIKISYPAVSSGVLSSFDSIYFLIKSEIGAEAP